ncbi:hypothetical protein [Parafrankia sp. FMc2]|uniref:hypothetical protein n=1 Tax=Parafrankia sp. FMc2 TaxID=3233196 RepID=UPI0034D5EEC4
MTSSDLAVAAVRLAPGTPQAGATGYDVPKDALDPRRATRTARNEVIRAALRVLAAKWGDETDPHFDAEQQYADELLALAARQLVDATDALPADQRPVGWARVFCDTCGQVITPTPDDIDEPKVRCCAACSSAFRATYTDEPPF